MITFCWFRRKFFLHILVLLNFETSLLGFNTGQINDVFYEVDFFLSRGRKLMSIVQLILCCT